MYVDILVFLEWISTCDVPVLVLSNDVKGNHIFLLFIYFYVFPIKISKTILKWELKLVLGAIDLDLQGQI